MLQKICVALCLFSGLSLAGCGQPTVSESLLSESQSIHQAVRLLTQHQDGYTSYNQVMVQTQQPGLASHTNITHYSGRNLESLPETVPAQNLLSPYAESVAYTYAEVDGPNCWNTSISSIFKEWQVSRYMHNTEFTCHVRTWFKETNKPKYGDLIRFLDASGRELHGATFVGVDSESEEIVVFTKNGYSKLSPWTFMSMKEMKEVYTPEVASVRFYEPQRVAIMPTKAGMDCFQEFSESRAASPL